jgi:hypothetical protein
VSNVAIKPRPTAVVLRGDFAKTNVEVDPSRVVIRVRQQPVLVRPVSPTTIVRTATQGPKGVSAQIITKLYAEVTTNIPANTDASGPSHDGNLDADLGDLSAENFLSLRTMISSSAGHSSAPALTSSMLATITRGRRSRTGNCVSVSFFAPEGNPIPSR